MNDPRPAADLASEGDINLSPARREWKRTTVDAATRAVHDADARHFLHQSLSTPCFDALRLLNIVRIELPEHLVIVRDLPQIRLSAA